jgi:glycosyltransferase involved in cell wall biosynthesis
MKKPSLLNDYLIKYSASLHWRLHEANLDNIAQVVVIPAYAEKEMLFHTLASIAANADASLERSLILCVINNKEDASDIVKENNAQTLKLLDALIRRKSFGNFELADDIKDSLQAVLDRPMKLGYIDASSNGLEIPPKVGGVGMARKIGMDMALRVLRNSSDRLRLILSLDADTLVQPDYLSAIRNYFSQGVIQTGIVAYEHQFPSDSIGQAAICRYEIFLRYWVLGLQYAGSPYAFYSIGSTIVTTADAYLSVRGMNRREAGEDFYFLNKLAKMGQIGQIQETVVYPSARMSARVPFGTGAAVGKIISGSDHGYHLYDPRIFIILKKWIELMKQSFYFSEKQILSEAQEIDPGLGSFLIARGFLSVWPKIRRNLNTQKTLERQFYNWFDGFETLKLINYLTKEYYPRINMFSALKKILELLNVECDAEIDDNNPPELEVQMKILRYLRCQA